MAQAIRPDAVLLDSAVPGMSGPDVCRALRTDDRTRDIPIIVLTAGTEETDPTGAGRAGADECVVKPVSHATLVARVKGLLRRAGEKGRPGDVTDHLGVRIDRVRHAATFGGTLLPLTPTEFRILDALIRQPGRTFDRAELVAAAIAGGGGVQERTIDSHIRTLRKKLVGAGADGHLIQTLPRRGYRFLMG